MFFRDNDDFMPVRKASLRRANVNVDKMLVTQQKRLLTAAFLRENPESNPEVFLLPPSVQVPSTHVLRVLFVSSVGESAIDIHLHDETIMEIAVIEEASYIRAVAHTKPTLKQVFGASMSGKGLYPKEAMQIARICSNI